MPVGGRGIKEKSKKSRKVLLKNYRHRRGGGSKTCFAVLSWFLPNPKREMFLFFCFFFRGLLIRWNNLALGLLWNSTKIDAFTFSLFCVSAGVGRTGVLIFMETAFNMIEGAEPIFPLEIVRRMRDQRCSLIQTPVSKAVEITWRMSRYFTSKQLATVNFGISLTNQVKRQRLYTHSDYYTSLSSNHLKYEYST